ncbi:MAG TPA: HAMP domain-containing sensor histidine kinase [Polyangiaceae bacterium LLY-WYZ-15_(1-7)]|nr:HAMP domain-containing sensor histidine kinase [Polyangiaceae bacterium LLY-WYZ-15_(1-7)]
MAPWRHRIIYFLLLPAIALSAGILGYYTWFTASRFTRLGEQTIAENTLLLVREKVETIEQYIIDQDNAAFALVSLDAPDSLTVKWLPVAEQLTPSIHALLLLDDTGEIVSDAFRGTARERRRFRKVFEERMLPELELERQRTGRLKHLHESFGGRNYLLSTVARRVRGRRVYIVAYHDTEYIVREELPRLFATEEGKRQYNVVSEDNRRIYGPSLANAGDYLVGHRFPTTLYEWRLQVAPKQAPQLERQGRSRRVTDLALLGIAFLVILLGVGFLLYAAAKERKLNDLKGEFIANVSHELKTPLSSVRMFGELLLADLRRGEGGPGRDGSGRDGSGRDGGAKASEARSEARRGKRLSDAKKAQYLEIIARESERLTSLIENVLDFAAIERGGQKLELRRGDVPDVVAHALETFRYRVEREGVDVELEVEGPIPPVMLDEQAIVLAVVNLLDNAVKYGGHTPITVTIEPVRDFVQVRVRDRGPGIPRDAEKRIFDRFYRGPRDDQDTRGSGIGLALVKQIAVSHGGRAWARSVPDEDGGGAVVGFALPALEATPAPSPEERAEASDEPEGARASATRA